MVLSMVNSRILTAVVIVSLFLSLGVYLRDADDAVRPLQDTHPPSNPFADDQYSNSQFSHDQSSGDGDQSSPFGFDVGEPPTPPLLMPEDDSFPSPSPEDLEMLEDVAETYVDTNTDPYEPFSPSISNKVAVVIEDRSLNNLVPLLLHFAAVLGPSWPVLIYTSPELSINLSSSPALSRWSRQIGIRVLPDLAAVAGRNVISRFLTSPILWDDLAPASHVLLFQTDSMICANAPQSVDDFLEWDFVGAPVAEAYGVGYNGGLSLRNRQKILDTVTQFDWEDDRDDPHLQFEDQWFYAKMQQLPDGAKLPSVEVAREFAVETVWWERPLGYHQPQRWQAERMPAIEEWCPEIKIALQVSG